MKEYSMVELIVEKEKYTKQGVRKGMRGFACTKYPNSHEWEVLFPIEEKTFEGIKYTVDIDVGVSEEDFKVVE